MGKIENKCTICEDKRLYTEILSRWLSGLIARNVEHGVVDIADFDERLEKNPKSWLRASFCINDILLSLLEEAGSDLQTYLCVPLSPSSQATKLEDITFSYLKSEISTTEAPMINLCPDADDNKCIFVEKLSSEIGKRAYFREMLNRKGNYDRGIYILKG